ncbi:MAG: hypothetical protein WCE68_10395 [Anaerolineales bacterium]
MNNNILIGVWRIMVSVPPALWQSQLAKETQADLAFMSPDHRRVHDFVVRELPHYNRPIPPEHIAAGLDLPLEWVVSLLDDLEREMTFLFRNPAGAVTWAYPVTVDQTPHQITFSSGEKLYAA